MARSGAPAPRLRRRERKNITSGTAHVNATRRARDLRPEVALGADLIAGFPTETEEMFRHSLDLIAECGLAFVHVFPYSPRPGTPAARMPPVPIATIKERAARLRQAGEAALAADLQTRIGSETDVLIEQPGKGRASFYAPVEFAGGVETGAVQRMRLVGNNQRSLLGVAV